MMGIPSLFPAGSEGAERAASLFDEGAPALIKAEALTGLEQVQGELDAMKVRAREALEEAERDGERLREQAREEGYAAGVAQVAEALARASAEYDRRITASEQDMLALAFALAERLVGHAVEADERVVQGMVASALEHVRGKRQVVILAHPEDVPALERARGVFSERLDGASVHVEPYGELARGGCLIETEAGRVDARLEVQLDVLRAAMMGG
jgi:flagellar biosynthesis/type III secretory pathway protein FliH